MGIRGWGRGGISLASVHNWWILGSRDDSNHTKRTWSFHGCAGDFFERFKRSKASKMTILSTAVSNDTTFPSNPSQLTASWHHFLFILTVVPYFHRGSLLLIIIIRLT
jgi:hypothetical protein